MGSVNRHIIHTRIAHVYDTAMGAQGQDKGITKYVKALRKSVGLKDPNAGDAKAFMKDFGKGL